MRSGFKGFYHDYFIDKSQLLKDATIVIDTNVLLDIYRYSKETATQILNMMDTLKDKLWMPYQVAYEYHKDRNEKVIGGHIRTYAQLISKIEEWEKSFNEERKHPFLGEDEFSQLMQHLADIREILCGGRDNCSQLMLNDEYKNKIADFYEGKLGPDYTVEDKEKYFLEAKSRYEKQIPPGYKDYKKSENEFGDYLIWKQMIDFSKNNHCPIIFVSNDIKEDWIEDVAGLKLGPRPELIDEFYKLTNQYFYCYSLKQFISIINERQQIVNEKAQHEIAKIYEEQQALKQEIDETTQTSSPLESFTGEVDQKESNSSEI